MTDALIRDRSDLPPTVRLLGFGRCSADMKEMVDKRVRNFMSKGVFGDREVTP